MIFCQTFSSFFEKIFADKQIIPKSKIKQKRAVLKGATLEIEYYFPFWPFSSRFSLSLASSVASSASLIFSNLWRAFSFNR